MPAFNLTEYFFASPPAVVKYQLFEISHPNFSSTFRIIRNAVYGGEIDVTHEGPDGPYTYTHYPVEIKTMGSTGNMDQEMEITFGDLGTILPLQLDQIKEANGMQTKPTIVYREYSSEDLNEPMFGPFTLSINNIAFNKTGAIFTAKPIAFNRGRTGEVYDVGRFPMLRGFF